MQVSLVGSKVLSYFSYVTVMCVFVGQPLVIAASGYHPLIDGVTAFVNLFLSASDSISTV